MCNRRRIVTARDQYEMLQPWTRSAAAHPEAHPDLHHSFAVHGTVHTTGGRVLSQRTAAGASGSDAFTGPQDTTFKGFHDPKGWSYHTAFEPSPLAVQGAKAYASLAGLPDPHSGATDYLNARRTPESVKAVAEHYGTLPTYDKSALPHFQSMADDVNKQHDFMTKRLGIKTQVTDYDPYSDVHEMLHDINNNKTLKLLGTHVTDPNGHPYFDNATNDKFRAVHDFFGHAASGRSFDRHGEQAAYLAHAQMFGQHAVPALATETRGQNSGLIYHGKFQPQKLAIMHPQFWSGSGNLHVSAVPDFSDQWQRGVEKDVAETGGFSRRGPNAAPPSGFMVSIPGAEHVEPADQFSGESAADYGRQHWPQMEKNVDLYQGGWKDDPHFFHDLSEHHTDMWDAAAAAKANDQDAFYHLDSGVAPYTTEFYYGDEPGLYMAGR